MIRVNMEKARDIKRDMIREERKPLLEALDVAYMRAVETKDAEKMAEIAAKKQTLRDCTKDPAINAALTAEELKLVTLSALSM